MARVDGIVDTPGWDIPTAWAVQDGQAFLGDGHSLDSAPCSTEKLLLFARDLDNEALLLMEEAARIRAAVLTQAVLLTADKKESR